MLHGEVICLSTLQDGHLGLDGIREIDGDARSDELCKKGPEIKPAI